MAVYQISSYGFVKWEGPPPQLVQQHVATFTKAGQAGLSAQLLGIHGNQFEVNLTAVIDTQVNGLALEGGYRSLVGASPIAVIFNNINYNSQYSHLYLVERVVVESFTRHPLLLGEGYVYPGGWKIRSRWTLTPIAS